MGDLALVVAGGAARGAYEAGVLRFAFTELPRRGARVAWPDIVTGTSVGAINAVHAAARSREGIERVATLWRELAIHQVFRMPATGIFSALAIALRDTGPFALFDARPLARLVHREFPAAELREAIDRGLCESFVIAATDIATGHQTLFVDSDKAEPLTGAWSGVGVRRVRMAPRHVLASAALPFVFPPVVVEDRTYVDGGIRMNTPLRPAVAAGASRALIIGVRQPKLEPKVPEPVTPSLVYLAGQTLNAVMLDPIERDRWELDRHNALLDWGERTYGEGFADAVERDLHRRSVKTLFIRPSADIGAMAADLYRAKKPPASPSVQVFLGLLSDRANTGTADLLSYFYFDRSFTGELEQLGFEDAERHEDQLAELLAPRVQ